MKSSRRITSADIVLLLLTLAFFLGLLFVFGPCGPGEDGWMTCHWAGQAARGVAGLMLALAFLRLLPGGPERKIGLDLALICSSMLAVLIPGRLIGLCMMRQMRCHSLMTPAVTVFSFLILLVSLVDLLAQRKNT